MPQGTDVSLAAHFAQQKEIPSYVSKITNGLVTHH